MNIVFVFLVAISVVVASFNGHMKEVMDGGLAGAKSAVEVAFGLIGYMVLFLGLIQVLRDAGAVSAVARGLTPIIRLLFPEIPAGHPAMGAIVMNLTANVFGLGNAATPFGLKAMQELNRLNPHPGVATNAMVLFLAINTAGLAVFPTGVIGLRASLGSADPGGIFWPTILSAISGTIVGVIVALALSRLPVYAPERYAAGPEVANSSLADGIKTPDEKELLAEARTGGTLTTRLVAWSLAVLFLLGVVHDLVLRTQLIDLCGGHLHDASRLQLATLPVGEYLMKELMSQWLIPFLLFFAVLFGWARGVKVYESAIKGAREGYQIFVMIVPFLVLILVGVGMFRGSGALDFVIGGLRYVTDPLGFPAEALPMALMRSLSGSGSLGVLTETMKTYGPDSFAGYVASVINGSSETTFYVLAVYFGSVQVRAVRHAVIACLAADVAGVIAALVFTRLLLF